MQPTAELLDRTTSPLQRAILLNWWRHVHLEGAGQFEKIVAPDMMVEHPVYRVTWGANPTVIEGKDGVLAFYNSVGEAVLWHSDDRIAVRSESTRLNSSHANISYAVFCLKKKNNQYMTYLTST